jgi:hypothetical protein
MSTAAAGGALGKRFVYLFQVEQELPPALEAAAGADSEIRFLSWRAPSRDPRSIHYPSSSWTQGRNRLLREVLDGDHEYVVFADDDIVLDLTALGAAAAGPGANPWRVFEDFLRADEPAVGCCAYDWHLSGGYFDPAADRQTLRFFDAILNAFHRETLTTLLPYYDLLDEHSECYSQNLVCSLAADLYPGHVLQTNRVHVTNREQRRGSQEFLLHRPEQLYLEALRDPERRRRFLRQSALTTARHPTMGLPRPRTGSCARSDAELAPDHDLSHVFWTRRRELLTLPLSDPFFSADADSPRAQRWRAVRVRPASPPSRPARHGLSRWAGGRLSTLRQHPAFRRHAAFGIARDLYRSRGHLKGVAAALRGITSRRSAPATWRRWWADTGRVLTIPESRQQEVIDLMAFAIDQCARTGAVFVDVGAGCGDVLQQLQRRLTTPLFALGIDPVDLRAHTSYNGFVAAAITDAPEGYADFYQHVCSDVSSLQVMNGDQVTHDPAQAGPTRYYSPLAIEEVAARIQVPTYHLSTIIEQYGLADDVLHFVKIDAQGSDHAVVRSLGAHLERCLFLRLETVVPTGEEPASLLYEGQSTFAKDRALLEAAGFRLFNLAHFGNTPEADATFVNLALFRALLPQLTR